MDTTLSTQQISERFANILTEQLGCLLDDIRSETKLGDLGADSLDKVQVTMAVEEDFCMDISYDDADNLQEGTVGEWVAFIFSRQ